MKVLYLLLLSGLLAGPALAEDDVLGVSREAVTAEDGVTAEPDETATEEAADDAETKTEDTTAEPEAVAEPEAATEAEPTAEPEAVAEPEKVDLLSMTATPAAVETAPKPEENLSADFKEKLISCTPTRETRTMNDTAENIEVLGLQDGKCKIKLTVFGLSVPEESLSEINTYEDLERLCKNPDVSTLEYTDNYNYANLMSELNQCANYQSLHHNGRSSTEYASIGVTVVTDMTAQHQDAACELTFVNEITEDNKFMNYSVICTVPDEAVAELLEPYRDLIDLYGAKEIVNADGSVSSRTAVSNKQTSHVDAKLMYELQAAGYCHMQEEQ